MPRTRIAALLVVLSLVLVVSGAVAATSALFVVGDTMLSASDSTVKKHLDVQGYQVTVLDDDKAAGSKPDSFDVVLISSSVTSSNVASAKQFLTTATPILNWENALLDDFQLTMNFTTAQSSVFTIADSGHPITKGLGAEVNAYTSSPTLHTGTIGVGKVIAQLKGTDLAAVAVVDKGEKLLDGSKSPNKRVHFAGGDDAFASITADGCKLLDQVLAWLLAK